MPASSGLTYSRRVALEERLQLMQEGLRFYEVAGEAISNIQKFCTG